MDSPLIVNLHCAFQDQRNLYMVLDFMPGGDLSFQSKALGLKLKEDVVQFWAANILLGLQYLHSKHFVHRDIKPENVMLDRQYVSLSIYIYLYVRLCLIFSLF